MQRFDVAIIGAGAAGMMCAAVAGQRGRKVVLIDHATKLAEKIRISGGGRCNFTNRRVTQENFISANPHFPRSALAGYGPDDFLALMKRYSIPWHEKHRGQLFCDRSAEDIIDMLRSECDLGLVQWRMPCSVQEILRHETSDGVEFTLGTNQGTIHASNLVIATGGLAVPQIGSTDYGLKVARQFGLKVVEPRPALVPLTFDPTSWSSFVPLSGIAIEAGVSTGAGKNTQTFLEDVLFTHRGLSGPGILQISSYWQPGEPISLDLAPGQDMAAKLIESKSGSRQQLGTLLATLWPKRLAEIWLKDEAAKRLADVQDRYLKDLGQRIHAWSLVPSGTAGYKKAEVMRGGVDTKGLDQRSMQARAVSGLYFIGETVDVTGWLGGYNFQWAWASGVSCGRNI